jgi:hypothetical protein
MRTGPDQPVSRLGSLRVPASIEEQFGWRQRYL